MSKKKDKKFEMLNIEYNKMRLKADIKRMAKRQEELVEKMAKRSGRGLACTAPY